MNYMTEVVIKCSIIYIYKTFDELEIYYISKVNINVKKNKINILYYGLWGCCIHSYNFIIIAVMRYF